MKKRFMGTTIIADGISQPLDDFETKRNNNFLIVGASGTSKTRSFVIPNVLEATGSYIISDPKGYIYDTYSDYMKDKGYEVFLIDLKNPERSCHYNPLDYVETADDALKLASTIYSKTQDTDSHKYWENSGIYLLAAIITYVKFEMDKKYHNINYIMDVISTRKIRIEYCDLLVNFIKKEYKVDSPQAATQGHLLLDAIKRDGYSDEKVDSYFKFMQNEGHTTAYTRFFSQLMVDGANDTKDCIYMEAMFALQQFSSDSVQNITSKSDFRFEDLDKKKMAIFVTCSDTDRSMDTFANMFYSQCLQVLCDYADTKCKNHRLKMPVRFFLDDFATNFKIVNFDKTIAMIRSRGISANIIIQDLHQLKTCYNYAAETIINNCDNIVYFGGNDYDTNLYMSKLMDVQMDDLRYMKYRECFVYRRMNKSIRTYGVDLDIFEKCKRNGIMYKRTTPIIKPKWRIGFAV